MKILVVEDDPSTGAALTEILTAHHYTVNLAVDGQTGLELARDFEYDLILLDVILPKLDGVSVCQQLRAEHYQRPILLLTAQDSSLDRVLGLDAGADDYVIKPFDVPELLARIRALVRREHTAKAAVLNWDTVQIDTARNEVTCNGTPLHLTLKEYCLLELFLLNPKRIFSRSAILDRLWDFAESPGEETVSTHIKCLRQKLKAAGAPDLIETVYGLGYRLKALPHSPAPTPAQPPKGKEAAQRTLAMTNKVWQKHQGTIAHQISSLEAATQALSAGTLTPPQQQQAHQNAHKLAGSLGIFGIMAGSRFAQELEDLLKPNAPLASEQVQAIARRVVLLRQVFDQAQTLTIAPVELPPYAPRLLIVDDDMLLAEQVRLEAIARGLRVELATDLDVARKVITQSAPDVILLDLNFPGRENGLLLLQELMQRSPPLPVLTLTSQADLTSRLDVIRLGASLFLQKLLPPREILNAVMEVLQRTQKPHANRVLVVDDDPEIVDHLSDVLQPLGLEVISLTHPDQFWHQLTTTQPNLVLLDLEMPGINGIELCQTVRSDPQWQTLPIVFLSANRDHTTIEQAFTAGADDYLHKSISPTELATRILHRLKRGGFQPPQP